MSSLRPIASKDVLTVILDGEAVLYDKNTATVHHLSPAATAVWRLLDGRNLDEISSELISLSQGDAAAAEEGLHRALDQLRECGLVIDH